MLWRLFCLEFERLNRGSTRWIAGEVQLGGLCQLIQAGTVLAVPPKCAVRLFKLR